MAQNSQAYQHYIHDVPVDPGFPRDFKFILVESIEQLRDLLSKPVNLFGFDIETTGLNSETDDIVSYSFCYESHVGYNVPVAHDSVVNGGNPGLGEEALDLVYEFMRDKARWVAIHNFAFESRMMEWHGFTSLDDYHKRMWLGLEPYVENEFFTQDQVSHYFKYDMGKIHYFDTMVSCWLSDTNDQKTGLKKYEEKFLGWRSSSFEDTLGDNVNFKFTNYRDPAIIEYTCLDAIGAFNLAVRTKRFLDEARTSGQIDMKFIYTIMRCSTLLQRLDPVVLKNYEDELSEHLYKLEQECWSIAGQPFNLKSPKDKARIFELLGLNTGEVGKAGVMKTGKELLNKLKKSLDKSDPNYKLLDNITQFGILSTVKNTFVKNLLNACESGGYRENFTRFNYKTTHVPCLTENNYVVVQGKGMISIKDVHEGDFIWTQYGFKKVLWNNSHMSDDVYRVTLQDGSFIEGTGHHPVLVNLNKKKNGEPYPEWSALTYLKDKELVIKNSHVVEDFDDLVDLPGLDETLFEGSKWNKNTKSNDFILPTKMTAKLARLIGFLDGDGSISNSKLKLCFNKNDLDLYDFYTSLVKDIFNLDLIKEECFDKRYGCVNGLVARVWCPKVCEWLDSIGVRGDSISEYILHSNPECWREYLAGFFDSDGRVNENNQIRIKTIKKQRMIDCQNLLSMLGINSLFRVRDKDRVTPIYEVYVSHKDWIVRFAMIFKNYLACSYKREACNIILDKYSEFYDLNQSEFISIEKVDDSIVYDIEVEDVHEYVANGIVTHNTGRLSAAGDKKSLGFFSDLNIQNIPKPHPADYHAISIQDAIRLNPELVELGRGDEPGSFKDVWYYQTSKRNCKIVRILGWLFTQIYWKNIIIDADGHTEKWPDDFPFNNEFENPMIEEGADQHLNIRSAMLPFDDDDYILSLDYSGQELKAAAMLSREPVWFDAFANGDDAHKRTAYAIFGKENYDKEKRKLAKGLNFGIIYGMEAYSIYSRGMAKTPEEAEDFYVKFKEGLPVLFNWLDSVVQDGKNNGTVYTMFGRPRRVKYWLDNDNFKFKAFGARTCKNTVVQGCLPYGTKILTDKGYIPIGKIFDSNEEVNVWTGMKYAKAVAVDKGEASLADIELENGMVLHCDNRHKVKVNDGENYVWKHIQDLKVGDLVCTNHVNCNPVSGDDLDYLMGYIIGDGHVTDNSKHHDVSIYFGNDSDSLLRLDKIKNIITSLGFVPHIRQVSHKTKNIVSVRNILEVYSVDFINLLRSRGLEPNQVSNTKTVPSSIWLSGAKEFLQGLYDSDGCKTYSVVRWHMNNESLLKDVAVLVNMFGYNSNLSRSGKYYILNTETGFKEFLLDSSRSDIRSKGKYMIPHNVALNAIELLDYDSLSSSAKVIYNRIKRGGSCNQYWLESLLGHNLYESYNFSKVSNIVFKDVVEHTYTMSVQDDLHQFISDGFVSKNTGADITKTALNRVFDNVLNVPKNKTIVRFMSTVHDEVNYSVKKKYFSSVAKTINKLMTIWIGSNDRFPFDTGLGIGLRWGELFDFDYDKKTFDILHPKWEPLPPKPVEYVVENSEEEVVEEITYDFSKMFEGLDEDGSNEF